MFLTGMVDKRTLEKYEKEAREKNRESWYLSWALDTNLEGKVLFYSYSYFYCVFLNFPVPFQKEKKAKLLKLVMPHLKRKRNTSLF